eukprot:Em0007g972a
MVLVRLCILDLTQRLPDLGSMVLVLLCILDLTQRLPDLGSMVLVRLCILDLTQRLPDMGSMVLVLLCILDLTQRLPDLVGGANDMSWILPSQVASGVGSSVIVVSPLKALMKDQVTALISKGVSAAYLNSDVDYRVQRDNVLRGEVQIVYRS